MYTFIFRLLKIALTFLLLSSHPALAGISIDSSRVIFLADDLPRGKSVGVTSSALTKTPYLVKAQVLGDIYGAEKNVPFSVVPALFRLEPDGNNQLKILKTGVQTLPGNKESVFYLRVMALPAGKGTEIAPGNELGGAVTVSTGNIVKLFYRPAGLPLTQQQAMASLQFSRQDKMLQVTNPSPYYITLTSLKTGAQSIPLSAKLKNTMIAPFSHMEYSGAGAGGSVTWQAINDFGGTETFSGKIQEK